MDDAERAWVPDKLVVPHCWVSGYDGAMRHSTAEIIREYGPFSGVDDVAGVTFDGHHIWFANGDRLNALDPESGKVSRSLDVAADAGTAYDVNTCSRSPLRRSARSTPSPAR